MLLFEIGTVKLQVIDKQVTVTEIEGLQCVISWRE